MLSWHLAAALQQSFAWAGLYSLLPYATFQFPTKAEEFALAAGGGPRVLGRAEGGRVRVGVVR